MAPSVHHAFLESARLDIARRVRELRTARRMTQAELGDLLELSQGRISQLEHGGGSFSAEQLLVISRVFNVAVSELAATETQDAAHLQVQNALARLGALDLWETENIVPDDRLTDPASVIVKALLLGDPRHVAAIAPVLIRQIDRLSLVWVDAQLQAVGGGRRLPWVVDNTVAALALERRRGIPRPIDRSYRRAEVILRAYLDARAETREASAAPDVVDKTIRSKQTLDEIRADRSEQSRRWGIISSLRPADFAKALEGARGTS